MNLSEIVRRSAGDFGDDPALVFQGRPVTFSRLDELVDLASATMAGLGLEPGDRVALVLRNVPEFLYALYGSLRAGAIVCPLNVMHAPEEIAYILADAEARVVVTGLADLPGIMAVRDRLGHLEQVVVVGGPPAPAGTVSLEEAAAAASEVREAATDDDDVAMLAYTAGTTATPRGAMLTHGNLLANLDQLTAVPELTQTRADVAFMGLPLFQVFAQSALGSCVTSGASAVLMEPYDTPQGPSVASGRGVSVVFGSPSMFGSWLSSPATADDLSSVRLAVAGPGSLPARTLTAFAERFGIAVYNAYGLSEAAGAATSTAVGPSLKPHSVGSPLPGVELKVVDEHGVEVEEGDPGEVLLRGRNVFTGYWRKPELTASVFDGGWLRTGDVGFRDDDGDLFLVDRMTDVIVVSGFHVYPKEVEDAIERHPKVAEAVVVGIPDDRTGEAVQAWIVPEADEVLSTEELLAFLDGYVARFKWPKVVEFVADLPRGLSGKARRRVLRGEAAT